MWPFTSIDLSDSMNPKMTLQQYMSALLYICPRFLSSVTASTQVVFMDPPQHPESYLASAVEVSVFLSASWVSCMVHTFFYYYYYCFHLSIYSQLEELIQSTLSPSAAADWQETMENVFDSFERELLTFHYVSSCENWMDYLRSLSKSMSNSVRIWESLKSLSFFLFG